MTSFKNSLYLPAMLTAFLFITSCEKDVVLDLANTEGNYLVVEANITDSGSRQWIKLSLSSSYYATGKGQAVKNALVSIEHGDTTFQFSHATNLDGVYYNDEITYSLEEASYELIIEVNGKTYTGESTYRPVPVLDSISLKISPFSNLGFTTDTIYDVFAHFSDLPGEGNHYLFNLFVNDTLRTPRPADKGLVSDINLEEYVSLSVLNINKADLKHRDTITLEMRSISKENFDFYNIFFFQTDLSGNPFAGAPPANIPTNMSNGARGFFQVSAVNKKTILFNDPPD